MSVETEKLTGENRYEYRRTKKQFLIRMPTSVHECVVGLIQEQWAVWKRDLIELKGRPK